MSEYPAILVTGATGFVGRCVVSALLAAGYSVLATGRTGGARLPENDRLTYMTVDLAEATRLPEARVVVHCAATSPQRGIGTNEFVRDNIVATQRLLTLAECGATEKLIFLSSLSVYGAVTTPVVDERTPLCDANDYGLSKRIGERLVANFAEGGRSALAIRLPGVIGPGAGRVWLSRVRADVMAGKPVEIFNASSPFNNAVHADDLGEFITALVEREWQGSDVVTIASAGEVSIGKAVDIVMAAAGRRVPVIDGGKRGHAFTVSSERACQMFGYQPKDIIDSIQRYAATG